MHKKRTSLAVFELFFRIYHLNFLQKADVLDLVSHGDISTGQAPSAR